MLMVGASYSGGGMLSAAENENIHAPAASRTRASALDQIAAVAAGRKSFLKNCAHCHGADARGDDGPDLHHLDSADAQIAARIRNGKKGQMTAFAEKFTAENISEVIAYLRVLK